QITLFGDFHTFRQSQRGFLRLLRRIAVRKSHRNITIGLECFRHEHQKFIDQYLAGGIDEHELLQQTRYQQTWGFPWEHYKDIVEFAKHQQIAIVGIDTGGKAKDSFRMRDHSAASVLIEHCRAHPNRQVLCLIGEYHLADNSLIAQIAAEDPALADQTMR